MEFAGKISAHSVLSYLGVAIRLAYDQLRFLDLPYLFASFGYEICLPACAWSFAVAYLDLYIFLI